MVKFFLFYWMWATRSLWEGCITYLANALFSDVCRHQAIICANAGILLIGAPGTNFSETLIEVPTFSFKKMHLKMSGKWRAFSLGFNMLSVLYWPDGADCKLNHHIHVHHLSCVTGNGIIKI